MNFLLAAANGEKTVRRVTMTWDDLLDIIHSMSAKERRREVRLIEPYDEPAVLPVEAVLADEEVEGVNGLVVSVRHWFLRA